MVSPKRDQKGAQVATIQRKAAIIDGFKEEVAIRVMLQYAEDILLTMGRNYEATLLRHVWEGLPQQAPMSSQKVKTCLEQFYEEENMDI
jgi:hypothetical protein